jgi:hypothetical protein
LISFLLYRAQHNNPCKSRHKTNVPITILPTRTAPLLYLFFRFSFTLLYLTSLVSCSRSMLTDARLLPRRQHPSAPSYSSRLYFPFFFAFTTSSVPFFSSQRSSGGAALCSQYHISFLVPYSQSLFGSSRNWTTLSHSQRLPYCTYSKKMTLEDKDFTFEVHIVLVPPLVSLSAFLDRVCQRSSVFSKSSRSHCANFIKRLKFATTAVMRGYI